LLKAHQAFKESPYELIYNEDLAAILNRKSGDLGNADVIFSLGGDGTVLRAAQLALQYKKPLIGLNLGNLGFLTELRTEELGEFLELLGKNKLKKDQRSLIRVKSGSFEKLVLNEVAIGRGPSPKLITLSTYLDSEELTDLRADGLIIATPTGSTAYSMAAGGPIVVPSSSGVIFNPICSHKLANRPLILSNFEKLKVKTHSKVTLFCDGEENLKLRAGDELFISLAKEKLTFLRREDWSFFERLRTKLNW